MDKIEVLKRSDLFRELDDEQLEIIEKIGDSRVFELGMIVHKQGSIIDRIHVVEDGIVGIIIEVGPMAQRQVQVATNFESFGWSAIIPPYIATATAKALEKTKTITFNGRELFGVCTKHPDIGFKVLQTLACVISGRLRQTYTQLLGVTDNDEEL